MKLHKHAELIKAWAYGAEIQYRADKALKFWESVKNPNWELDGQYRIKPQRKPDVMTYYYVNEDKTLSRWTGFNTINAELRIIVDGKTGKLKSAEVL